MKILTSIFSAAAINSTTAAGAVGVVCEPERVVLADTYDMHYVNGGRGRSVRVIRAARSKLFAFKVFLVTGVAMLRAFFDSTRRATAPSPLRSWRGVAASETEVGLEV